MSDVYGEVYFRQKYLEIGKTWGPFTGLSKKRLFIAWKLIDSEKEFGYCGQ